MSIENYLEQAYRKKYKVYGLDSSFTPYNLNIIGWRTPDFKLDKFNDKLAVYYITKEGKWIAKEWPITTLPGKYSLVNLSNSKGCAILKEGQYHGAYKLGLHKGKKALVQVKPVTVYRDSNKNYVHDLDELKIETGLFGINIHRAGAYSTIVGSWSAGCQVFQTEKDFLEFYKLCELSSLYCGDSFTYTLITKEK